MGRIHDDSTKVILQNLGKLFFLWYTAYFALSFIFSASFGIKIDGKLPFDHNYFGFSVGHSLAAWLSMVVAFIFEVFILYYVVQSTKNSWDYAVTLSFFHFVMTCIVKLSFPVNYIWWVTFIVGTILVCVAAELACYYLRDMRVIRLPS
eukprot:TRINITY_DN2599_c0_g1_i1.p1 TRINITY_DN2599_c0_g1~~TRINITY_DN2599_c0_g1_i1.p1  ORF type:complete len:149 (-),score=19.87 TRINITY_DN2599_c0_g1_i1:2-448(-)